MAHAKSIYVCQDCGYRSPRWLGRCTDCGGWNTLVEERIVPQRAGKKRSWAGETNRSPVRLAEVDTAATPRLASGIEEFDRVLGGGLVPGSVVLIGGDPGIGKSTLVLQALAAVGSEDRPALYVSGEESPEQIKMRAERLGLADRPVWLLAETAVETIVEHAQRQRPQVLAIDSIQTMWADVLESAPGNVSQVRECAARFVRLAKQHYLPTLLIGHVTKEGAFAGPRVLEHMVDTVLYFEGDRSHAFRILRSVKNRFGSTNEIGVFEMTERGLQPVGNPSAHFLAERPRGAAGSVVAACMEGTRPVLIEVQALVSPSALANPRRTTLGFDPNRASMLVAVLEKKLGVQLLGQDVFVNAAGGIRINEPAADLALIAALGSSFLDRPLDPELVVFGEVGLAGEVRGVQHTALRVQEAARLGLRKCLLPRTNARQVETVPDIRCIGVASLSEAWDVLFGR
ncbi:MAG: DNA repair protein RadA [Candidatus Binatia bacterium]|nr:MAG: DNA repair protein RadA [Candidatus Binatia bacterium]